MIYFCLCVVCIGMPAEGCYFPVPFIFIQEILKAFMVPDIHFPPVVQARPFEMLVIHLESKGMDEMKPDLCGCAKPGDITSISRNFRLIEDHLEGGIFYDAMLYLGNIPDHRLNS